MVKAEDDVDRETPCHLSFCQAILRLRRIWLNFVELVHVVFMSAEFFLSLTISVVTNCAAVIRKNRPKVHFRLSPV